MNTFVSFVLLAFCTSAAVPSILSAPLEKRANFSVACHGNAVDANGVLTSTCSNNLWIHLPACLSLNSCVSSVDGHLIRGSGFLTSCQGFTLVNPNGPGVVLIAQCINNDAITVITGLNLDKFVDNDNGALHC